MKKKFIFNTTIEEDTFDFIVETMKNHSIGKGMMIDSLCRFAKEKEWTPDEKCVAERQVRERFKARIEGRKVLLSMLQADNLYDGIFKSEDLYKYYLLIGKKESTARQYSFKKIPTNPIYECIDLGIVEKIYHNNEPSFLFKEPVFQSVVHFIHHNKKTDNLVEFQKFLADNNYIETLKTNEKIKLFIERYMK